MTFWGLWILITPETFNTSPSWNLMGQLASPFAWGASAVLMGVSKSHFIVKKNSASLYIVCLASGYYWMIVSAAILFSNWRSPGWTVYFFLGIYELWLYKKFQG
jgi:hypothetical protein